MKKVNRCVAIVLLVLILASCFAFFMFRIPEVNVFVRIVKGTVTEYTYREVINPFLKYRIVKNLEIVTSSTFEEMDDVPINLGGSRSIEVFQKEDGTVYRYQIENGEIYCISVAFKRKYIDVPEDTVEKLQRCLEHYE